MVTVRVSETYDMSTQVDKMGLIGIHTPSDYQVRKLYDGLFKNYKFARLVGCDVTIACASMLPADPQQIGVEAGDIAPQDMFNPLLYKAVSNESFNTILNRIMGGTSVGKYSSMSVSTNDVDVSGSGLGTTDWDVYYGLLGDTDGWRKAMPQAGLEMKGLYPMVFHVLSNVGQQNASFNYTNSVPGVGDDGYTSGTVNGKLLRGNATRMPRLPLHLGSPGAASGDQPLWFPTTYVGVIITPPAKLNKLYYRMKVTWTIEFEELIPTTDYDSFIDTAVAGFYSYGTDYVEQSSKMDVTDETVDVRNANLEHVMTSAR